MKLITEVNESIKVLKEQHEGKPRFFIEGIFLQAEKKNRNGRVYPVGILRNEVDKYVGEFVEQNRAFGELGHPDGPTVNLERVSHMITELYEDGNNFIGKAKIMETPYGKIVANLLSEGAKLGVSSRGMGSVKERAGVNYVQDDFSLATAADIVADPSAPDAFVDGIMEGKEWVWNNGILEEVHIDKYKKAVKKAPARKLNETKINAFRDFISRL
mgnify:FL=1|jgi:hypothetical protein|tara:strand:- start:234 stop:878 length:645 start_codon:yes stop_codon:yes gene_type:complete